MDIPIEIFQSILNHSDFLTQIRIRCASKLLYTKMEIHDLYDIADKYLDLLSDDILQVYPLTRKLNAKHNGKITNVNCLTQLEVLNANTACLNTNECTFFFSCGIGDDGISNLNLKELYACNNCTIINLNHMSNLKVLDASSHYCSITNQGIQRLTNLKKLDVTFNDKITDINHMTNLVELNARGHGINDANISNLNLKILNVTDNPYITNVNHMPNLEKLWAYGHCGINDAGISELNLKFLDAGHNPRISDIKHMGKLEILYANGQRCGLGDAGIVGLNLTELQSDRNFKIHR